MLSFQASVRGGDSTADALGVTFDQALLALERLGRLFIEPDGSFVWTGCTEDGQAWQVDGNLVDRGDVLAYVELKGSCPDQQFDRLVTALGWPGARVVFQLPRRGVFLDEAEFRALAASDAGAI